MHGPANGQRPTAGWQYRQASLPRLPSTYVPRPELWRQLDIATTWALTVLVAPAGAGKTLGVGGWLRRAAELNDTSRDPLWLRADASWDDDRLRAVLHRASTGVAASLSARAAGPALVVVDDAHLLPAAALHLVDRQLVEAPHSIRMLLLSRWELPLSRLVPQMLGHLTILRANLLQMDHVADQASAAGTLQARAATPVHDVAVRPSLTPRQHDVLVDLSRGATYADIAADLCVSENTVKTHVSSLYDKLGASRRSDALATARVLGIL